MQYRTAAFLAGRLARAKRAILATLLRMVQLARIHSTSGKCEKKLVLVALQ